MLGFSFGDKDTEFQQHFLIIKYKLFSLSKKRTLAVLFLGDMQESIN